MRKLLYFFCIFSTECALSQLVNSGFENASGADLTAWQWTCGAESMNTAPVGSGNWSIKVFGGNPKSCFPGYAYQKLSSITDGQAFTLSAWAYAEVSSTVGIYFGKVNNGVITLQEGVTTAAAAWEMISVQNAFNLAEGDTAVVVLYGGMTGGPTQGFGHFDAISLQPVTEVVSLHSDQSVRIFPNPFSETTKLYAERLLDNATLSIYDSFGRLVVYQEHVQGQMVELTRENLVLGIYSLVLSQDNHEPFVKALVIGDRE